MQDQATVVNFSTFGETLFKLFIIRNSSPGVSYAASYPCICWHYRHALYLVDGLHSQSAGDSHQDGAASGYTHQSRICLYTHLAHLVGYRKVTHLHMRFFQALLEKSSQNISSQVLL